MKLAVDADFNGRVIKALFRNYHDLDIVRAYDAGLADAPDPVVLEWAASEGRILLTHDRHTMAGYAKQRIAANLPMPGVFVIRIGTDISVRWSRTCCFQFRVANSTNGRTASSSFRFDHLEADGAFGDGNTQREPGDQRLGQRGRPMPLVRAELRRIPFVNDSVVADDEERMGLPLAEFVAEGIQPSRRHPLLFRRGGLPFELRRALGTSPARSAGLAVRRSMGTRSRRMVIHRGALQRRVELQRRVTGCNGRSFYTLDSELAVLSSRLVSWVRFLLEMPIQRGVSGSSWPEDICSAAFGLPVAL